MSSTLLCGKIENIGYHAESSVLQATEYGIPQIRKRLFIVASKTKLNAPFPASTHTSNGADTLFHHGPCAMPFSMGCHIRPADTLRWGRGGNNAIFWPAKGMLTRRSCGATRMFSTTTKAMRHNKRTVERFAAMSWGDSVADVPHHLRPRRRNSNEIAQSVYDPNNRRQHPYGPMPHHSRLVLCEFRPSVF